MTDDMNTARRVGDITIPMPGREALEENNRHYRAALAAYVAAVNRRDVEALVALFAEEAVIEDLMAARGTIFAASPLSANSMILSCARPGWNCVS